eukprot:scaffold15496_cov298-Ochromonas_danica.AAC.1
MPGRPPPPSPTSAPSSKSSTSSPEKWMTEVRPSVLPAAQRNTLRRKRDDVLKVPSVSSSLLIAPFLTALSDANGNANANNAGAVVQARRHDADGDCEDRGCH